MSIKTEDGMPNIGETNRAVGDGAWAVIEQMRAEQAKFHDLRPSHEIFDSMRDLAIRAALGQPLPTV